MYEKREQSHRMTMHEGKTKLSQSKEQNGGKQIPHTSSKTGYGANPFRGRGWRNVFLICLLLFANRGWKNAGNRAED